VEDSGRGIPPEDRPRIFEKFSRLSATAAETKGTGLGLFIAKQFVDLIHGAISVDAGAAGNGTLFRIVFPLSLPEMRALPQHP
jgi:signal transduction histidine kinase